MADALSKHSYRRMPQSEQAREDQVKNSAGGYTFKVSDAVKLNRFLVLGTDGGTYYVSEHKLTKDNAQLVIKLAQSSNPLLINEAVKVSVEGRAPRNNAALFAIAAASALGDESYRKQALDVLPQVARTGTHILQFAAYREQFGGWGRGTTKAVGRWYAAKEPEAVAYQLLKYQQRDGWSQRDLLRLSHLGRTDLSPVQKALFSYVMKGETPDALAALPLVEAVHKARRAAQDPAEVARIIRATKGLSWEMLPSEVLGKADIWRALFESGNLPLGALLRNLARMTTNGAIKPMDQFTGLVTAALTDPAALQRARIHPVAVLLALKTYQGGHSLRGKGTWTPVAPVIDALDEAFYASFRYVEASGKRIIVALDVSGSMGLPISGLPISSREAAAAMAMTQLRTEPNTLVVGFTAAGGRSSWSAGAVITPLTISKRQRLDDVVHYTARLPFGGTDCALPMTWALKNKVEADVIQIWTDNETWAGGVHPHQALRDYRGRMGIDARLQVAATTATDFTIADPLDSKQLDVAGFDAAVPVLLANHARGLV